MIERIKSLKAHNGFMKYFKNTSWLVVEKILRLVVGLFVGVWVARYLGPKQFGVFSYVQSFVALFTPIASFGLDSIIIRELVKDESRRDELIGTAFLLKLLGALGVLVILVFAVKFTSNDIYTNTLVYIIASASIFQSFSVVDFYFQSKVLSKYVVYSSIFSLIMSSVIKIILVLNDAPLMAFAWVVLFDSFVLACCLIYFYVNNISKFNVQHLTFKSETAILLLKDSWPLILSSVVISIYMKIDQVMIKEMLDTEAVGHYAVAVRLSEAWYFIPMVIVSSLFPAIINAKKISEKLYYSRLQKLYQLLIWFAIAIALPTTLISQWVVDLLYGDQYNEAGSILRLHIWAGVFVFFGTARGNWLIIENLQKIGFYYLFFGAVVNILMNLILIEKMGIQGAAIATIISLLSIVLFFPLFHKVTRRSVLMFFNSLDLRRILK